MLFSGQLRTSVCRQRGDVGATRRSRLMDETTTQQDDDLNETATKHAKPTTKQAED